MKNTLKRVGSESFSARHYSIFYRVHCRAVAASSSFSWCWVYCPQQNFRMSRFQQDSVDCELFTLYHNLKMIINAKNRRVVWCI